ncbi:uncharacterized protein [Diadema setosum]|uniref:uncharacterized protein n=1 Tax=Diadema setosum TaxID=31175 RepID=UPI003B3B2D5C
MGVAIDGDDLHLLHCITQMWEESERIRIEMEVRLAAAEWRECQAKRALSSQAGSALLAPTLRNSSINLRSCRTINPAPYQSPVHEPAIKFITRRPRRPHCTSTGSSPSPGVISPTPSSSSDSGTVSSSAPSLHFCSSVRSVTSVGQTSPSPQHQSHSSCSGLVVAQATPSPIWGVALSGLATSATPSTIWGATPQQSSSSAVAPVAVSIPRGSLQFQDLVPMDNTGYLRELGRGTFGVVYLMKHLQSKTPVALKLFTLPSKSDPDHFQRVKDDIDKEANMLLTFSSHPAFPRFYGSFRIDNEHWGIAMEFVGNHLTGKTTELYEALHGGQSSLSPNEWLQIAGDISKGLEYIHIQSFLHNDLKSDNILLHQDQNGKWRGRLIDLGYLCHQSSPLYYQFTDAQKQDYLKGNCFPHIAPECAVLDDGTSIQSDIFQLGRLLKKIGDVSCLQVLHRLGEHCTQESHLRRPSMVEILNSLANMVIRRQAP